MAMFRGKRGETVRRRWSIKGYSGEEEEARQISQSEEKSSIEKEQG